MNNPDINLTTQINTRRNPAKLSMRWPVDEDTTRRLRRVIRPDPASPVPWWRKLLRLVSFAR